MLQTDRQTDDRRQTELRQQRPVVILETDSIGQSASSLERYLVFQITLSKIKRF